MSDVIFVRPRHDYQSYADLYALIGLSGFPLIYADELDPASDATYIVTIYSGETAGGWPPGRARIILWDFEWRSEPLPPVPGVGEVWYSDAWQARVAGGRYVPMGGHEGLTTWQMLDTDQAPPYDAAFLGYIVPRRQRILTELQARGVRTPETSAWGFHRHLALCQSRSYLHIHQHDHAPGVPALRLVVAAAYRLPLISEAFADPGIFGPSVLLTSDDAHLADFTRLWTRDHAPMLQDRGDALHRLLCADLTFRKSVEQAL